MYFIRSFIYQILDYFMRNYAYSMYINKLTIFGNIIGMYVLFVFGVA